MFSYSTMMHEYFDRTLDSALEDVLFTELGRNTELRREFSEHLMLRTVVQNDVTAIRTPLDSTSMIFSELGFALPSSEDTVIPPIGIFSRFFQRYSALVGTALVSSAVTALLFLSSDSPEQKPGSTSSVKLSPVEKTAAPTANTLAAASPEKTVASHDRTVKQNKHTVQAIVRDVEIPAGAPEETVVSEETSRPFIVLASQQSIDAPRISEDRNYPGSMSSIMAGPATGIEDLLDIDMSKVSVQLRRSSTLRSYPEVELPTNSNSPMKDISASLLYNVAEGFSAGVSVGQETFAQEFQLTKNNQSYTYRQNPMLTWYGFTAMWEMREYKAFGTIRPYGQITVGATETAPLGRALLGIEYSPIENFSINCGAEGSILYYTVQNNYYSSSKLGLNYGFSIRF